MKLYFSVNIDGQEFEACGEVFKGEKRTRNHPGALPHVDVNYGDLECSVGRELTRHEIVSVEDTAQQVLCREVLETM